MALTVIQRGTEYHYYYTYIGHGGYRFNVIQRCISEVGITPLWVGDLGYNDSLATVVAFASQLSAGQISLLDTLMTSNPQYPPSPGTNTRYIIKDIYEFFEQFKIDVGVDLKIYYSETVPGSGKIDRIEIIANKTMTAQEKNRLRNSYSGLITEG